MTEKQYKERSKWDCVIKNCSNTTVPLQYCVSYNYKSLCDFEKGNNPMMMSTEEKKFVSK